MYCLVRSVTCEVCLPAASRSWAVWALMRSEAFLSWVSISSWLEA